MSAARDRTTVRRALGAGGVTALVVAVPLVGVAVLSGSGLVLPAVLVTVMAGLLVTDGWLLLALLLDVIAGDPPSGRRVAISAGVTLLTLLTPFLVLAAVSPA